jgi:crotonobetainyl-CoA:carnitine CoA-transferase CaiB-like acyl-CoA transferase
MAFESPQPLSGVRVLALGAFVAGNVCPLVLAELGADVVKIESRQRPESLRSYFSPDHDTITEPSGVQTTAMFSCLARSMRSVCVEVDQPGGADTLRSLAQSADILIENMGPGVMQRWGCSYSELAAGNPRLVMVSISGYGRTGPRGSYRAYGSSIANYLGLASVWAHDGVHFDFVAAYHGALIALGAWMRATDTGSGTYLDVSQVETGMAPMAPLYLDALVNSRPWSYGPNEVPGSVLSAVLQCAGEDAWVAVDIEDLDDLRVLADVLERPEFSVSDDNGASAIAADVRACLEEWASTLTPLQVSFKLQRAGLAAAPVQNTEDLWRDPQLRARGAFVDVEHPDIGLMEQPQSPDRMSVTPGHVRGRARRLGEDTVGILREWLDLDEVGIEALLVNGAVYQVEGDGLDEIA